MYLSRMYSNAFTIWGVCTVPSYGLWSSWSIPSSRSSYNGNDVNQKLSRITVVNCMQIGLARRPWCFSAAQLNSDQYSTQLCSLKLCIQLRHWNWNAQRWQVPWNHNGNMCVRPRESEQNGKREGIVTVFLWICVHLYSVSMYEFVDTPFVDIPH